MFEKIYTVRADRGTVWSSLTTPDAVRVWFAEHAEIQPRVGGAYRFWGRHTPTFGYPDPENQSITALEERRALSFDWLWAGVPSAVTLELADTADGATALHVRQTFPAALADFDTTETLWIAKDFWRLAAHNLEAYCQTGAPALLPDHSVSGGDAELSIRIEASPALVWKQLIDPACVAAWLGGDPGLEPRITIEPHVGGTYSYGWEHEGQAMGPSEILELEPERRLVVRWHDLKGTTDTTAWEIDPIGDSACRLTVRQLNTGSAKETSGYLNGWAGFMLDLASRVGTP